MRQKVRVNKFPVEANGVDMIAESETEICLFEINNHKFSCYIANGRFESMLSNYSDVIRVIPNECPKKVRKILVISYSENAVYVMTRAALENVEIKIMEGQDILADLNLNDND
jgi:hypothetical protein